MLLSSCGQSRQGFQSVNALVFKLSMPCRSAGVSLYVMITGMFPFARDSDESSANVVRMQVRLPIGTRPGVRHPQHLWPYTMCGQLPFGSFGWTLFRRAARLHA